MKASSSSGKQKENSKRGKRSVRLGPHTESKTKHQKKILVTAKTKAPGRSSPEIAILSILSRAQASGVPTAAVLREVKEKWFPGLSAEDLSAVYPESKKNVVDTVVKFARKHLVERGQVHTLDDANPVGTWRITSSGMERALREQSGC